ncbi:MAG: alkaline phosphatase family protein [Xanthobacteraceae bacterium]
MPRIEHVVVLMLENRSFDNVLGRLYPKSDRFDGLDLTESNPWHRPDGSIETIAAWSSDGPAALCLPEQDPGEAFDDFNMQIFGLGGAVGGQPSMNGFVDDYTRQKQTDRRWDPRSVMHHFLPDQVPVISALAKAFAVSDRWFASAPCETWPNRYFTHAGTAGGYVNNERSRFPYRWPRFLPTIFRRLEARGHSWRVYFHDLPQAATLVDLWPRIPTRFCLFDAEFERHARSGRLAAYSFIEPRYYANRFSLQLPNDQHPPHEIAYGEQLIARVYNAVREAPTWERTLLLIIYDEHGGCFDHVPPPRAVSPGPR